MRTVWKVCFLGYAVTAASFSLPQTPMHEVNRCMTVPQLEQVLSRLSKAKDEPSKAALLWGSILFEGFKKREVRFPGWLLEAGRKAAYEERVSTGTKAMQAWWMSTIADKYVPPDFRKMVVDRYETFMYNGKLKRFPIYRSPDEEERDKHTRLLVEGLLRVKVRQEEHVIAFAWQRKPNMPVSDAEVAKIANRLASPWRAVAIGELSLRERLKGENGPWSGLWNRIVKNPRPLAVEAMLTEHRERLAKKKR